MRININTRILYTFILVFLTCLPYTLHCFPRYFYKQLSLNEGLSQTTVTCILKDHKGVIWIGTQMGLNRFDQYELKNYFIDANNAYSLPDNNIVFIAEDAELNLWIATQTGLVMYDRGKDQFIPQQCYHDIVAKSYTLVDDGIVFGGAALWKYSYNDHTISLLDVSKDNEIKDYVTYIRKWRDDLFIAGTRWNGVYLYDNKTQKIDPFTACNEAQISAYLIDDRNNLWLSPYGKGLVCFDTNGNQIYQYNTENSALTNDIVLDMALNDHTLWIATDGGGIMKLNLNTHTFTTIPLQTSNNATSEVSSVSSLYFDKSNNLWVGTVREGLLNLRQVYMNTYLEAPLNSKFGMTNKTAQCFHEEDGYIYVGTDGGGVNRFNQADNSFYHYPACNKEKVVSITGFNANELIISIYGKGLFFFNKTTGQYRPCHFIDKDKQTTINNMGFSIGIYQFKKDHYYIFADKVYIYHDKDKTLQEADVVSNPIKNSELPNSLTTNFLKIIDITDSVTYLKGITNIFVLDHQTLKLKPIYYAEHNLILNDVCIDSIGNFWLATNRGLKHYNANTQEIEAYTTNLFSEPKSVVYTPGKIWIGANNMLFAYSIDDKEYTVFDESDGALPNEYLSTSNYIAENGDIYMCGAAGLLRIGKDYPFEIDESLSIELMDVVLNGAVVTNKVTSSGHITIPYNHTSLTIKTINNADDVFRKRLYRFHVSGLSQVIETYSPTYTLYALPPGTHTIKVSNSQRDGKWSTPKQILTVTVQTAWWKNPLFIFGIVLSILGLTFLYIRNTNRRRVRKLEWEMKEHQENLNEEKIQFLINMSHEIRTPLTLIYGPLKRLLHQNVVTDSDVKGELESIYKQVDRTKSLIEMVLDVRKLEIGKNTLHLSTLSFNNWIKEVADCFTAEYKEKGIELKFELDPTIEEWNFDKEKCEMVISNLLSNAMKFTPAGKSVTIKTLRKDDIIQIKVEDEGKGINEDDLTNIFTTYYQGKNSKEGSGIGLSYVKMIVELHGGKIHAENNVQGGASFIFYLPQQELNGAVNSKVKISLNEVLRFTDKSTIKVEEEELFDTKPFSILVVEDDLDLCRFLKMQLKEHFGKVYCANNGHDALLITQQRLPDIIVSDVMMDNGDGLELCRQLKNNDETSFIPIVLLTARTDSEIIASSYKSGADIYLVKPFETEELISILRNLLKNRKRLQNFYRNLKKEVQEIPKVLTTVDDTFSVKLNNIIADNLNNSQLSADFIAEKMGMSRTSLYNKAKSAINVTISDYINRMRIEKVLQLLSETDMSILEISEEIGFNNQRYFSTFFKKMVGCTPTKYREESRK